MADLNLWLQPIPTALRSKAIEAFEAGDVVGFLVCASNEWGLHLVQMNLPQLRSKGIYEKALLNAFAATRTNHHGWPLSYLQEMFGAADRSLLRSAGDPLPGPGPFTIYRGVAGLGRARRIRGISWTASAERAWWFAQRVCHLPDPAVFCTVVDESDVLACVNERNEQEFLVLLKPIHKIQRVTFDPAWPEPGKPVAFFGTQNGDPPNKTIDITAEYQTPQMSCEEQDWK